VYICSPTKRGDLEKPYIIIVAQFQSEIEFKEYFIIVDYTKKAL